MPGDGKEEVPIFVNGQKYTMHRGNQPVSEIKRVAGVPAAYELDEIIDGQLKPLADNGSVVIQPNLQFSSQPPVGQGSSE